jgi:predicted kinase
MVRLIMTMGLPGSGKSTWAAEQEGFKVVNKDNIRAALAQTGWVWSHKNEEDVLKERDQLIVEWLGSGHSVISSDTNFGRKHKVRLSELARTMGAEFEIKRFDVPLEVCIERDASRPVPVGEKVIRQMWTQFIANDPDKWPLSAPKPAPLEKVKRNYSLPMAVICDLDGTIALNNGHRSFYDASTCDLDILNEPIAGIIMTYDREGLARIIYCTGREEIYRPQTEKWLKKYGLPEGPLFMRAAKDHRKDRIVKLELFNNHIRDKYDVEFVLDDRDQVVNMWRELGLTCLQVAPGAF